MLKTMYAGLKEVKNPSFLTEWNDKQFDKVNKVLKKFFFGKTLKDHNGRQKTLYTLSQIEDFFGLPYTSTSEYAMISNCNCESFIDNNDTLNIEHFALSNDNHVVMVTWDRQENERYFVIG